MREKPVLLQKNSNFLKKVTIFIIIPF